ncbi:hypothetical protein F4779DRAFT_617240 [Xylariaceae sp. FL0662B]|nr:hypothetical protein F4779DRAFT_617240 [Xylariaceae sp. FL0662B]
MAASVDAKLLRATKFPLEFNQKVDMQKVNHQVMKKWIASKISEILGSEDDVVTELCFNLIEGSRYPDIKSMQIQLTGFLDKDTAPFCKDLWKLCLSAQSNPQGVPKELLEAKKLELIQEKQISETKNAENVDSVVAVAIIGAAEDVAAIEPSETAVEALAEAVTALCRHQDGIEIRTRTIVTDTCRKVVAEVGKTSGVAAPQHVLQALLQENPHLVPACRARLATVAAGLAIDLIVHLVTVLGDIGHRLVIEHQQRETGPPGEGANTARAETAADETPLLQTATAGQLTVGHVRHHQKGAGIRIRSVVRDHPRVEMLGGSVARLIHAHDHQVVVLDDDLLRRSSTRSLSPPKSSGDPKRSSLRGRGESQSPSRRSPSRKRRHSANSPRTRDKSADVSEDEDKHQPARPHAASVSEETKTPQQQANELREKLLKERIKKMRRTSSSDIVNE